MVSNQQLIHVVSAPTDQTMIKTIIFDLDGTIADTRKDIASAVNYVRKHFGLKQLTIDEVVRHVGSGVTRLIEKTIYGDINASPDEIRKMIIKYYGDHLVEETVLYKGILDLLNKLFENYILAIATNKPLELADNSIRELGIKNYFKVITGPETTGEAKPDPEMISYIANRTGAKPKEILVVGDSPVDIEVARNFGCKACSVSWGYNDIQLLKESKPDFIINSPAELLNYI